MNQNLLGWIREWKFGIILFLNAVVFFSLFYSDLTRRSNIGSREIIGDVSFKFNKIQRKFEKEVTWTEIDANSPLTNRDSVRTEKNSIAVIQLKDGTEIEMDEDSMVILEISPKKQKINFEKGSINIKKNKVENQESSGTIMVESPGGKVELHDGDVIVAKNDNKNLDVAVSRGTAMVELEGKSIQLKKDQKLVSTENGEISARDSKVRMEDVKRRSIAMEKKIVSSVVPKLNLKKDSDTEEKTDPPNVTSKESPAEKREEEPIPEKTTPKPTSTREETKTKNAKKEKTPPTQKNSKSDPEMDEDELRRRKEQIEFERFMKM